MKLKTRIKTIVNIQKKIHLQNREFIYIIKYMISIKTPQIVRKKNLNFSQELPKDKCFQTLGPAIHLEGWGKHFESEYIIKPCKNLVES